MNREKKSGKKRMDFFFLYIEELGRKSLGKGTFFFVPHPKKKKKVKKSSKNRTNPYLGCLTSGAPDLEGKNRKKERKEKTRS